MNSVQFVEDKMRKMLVLMSCLTLTACETPLDYCTRNLGSMMFLPICLAEHVEYDLEHQAKKQSQKQYRYNGSATKAHSTKITPPKKTFSRY
jgi:hypothetical protein